MAVKRRPQAQTLPRRMSVASATVGAPQPTPDLTSWPPGAPHPGRYDPNNPPRLPPESTYPAWGYGIVDRPRLSPQPTEATQGLNRQAPLGSHVNQQGQTVLNQGRQNRPQKPPGGYPPTIPPQPVNPPRPPLTPTASSTAVTSKPTLTAPTGPNAPNRQAPAGYHVNQRGETVPNAGRQDQGPQDQGPQEQTGFDRWWENRNAANPYAQMNALRPALEALFAQGVTPEQLRGLFSEGVQTLFAPNAAGGQGERSPYVDYFNQNPQALLQLLQQPGIRGYVGGGQVQEKLFAQFPGLRDSYLSSLGLKDVNGRVVNPTNPRQTPFQAERASFLGPEKQTGATEAQVAAQTPATISGYVPSSQGGFGPDVAGTTPAASADPILAESQAFVARAQQAANEISAQLQNLPLDPQFTAQRRILEDQLQQNLQIVQNGATNLAAQRKLAQARLSTEQEQDVQALKDALAGRGTLSSSSQFGTGLGEMATEYQRLAQDLNADIAAALQELYTGGTGAVSDYTQGIMDALQESAYRISNDDYTPVGEGPSRPRTRPRKNKPKK